MLDTERMILELEEFAKVSLIRSCKLSYLKHSKWLKKSSVRRGKVAHIIVIVSGYDLVSVESKL